MEQKYHYATVSNAINELNRRGYIIDFNLKSSFIDYNSEKINASDFEIKEVYRYEGDSDPADEATVYGIQSKDGLKGILVTGYGIYTDNFSDSILNKLISKRIGI